MEIIKQIFDKEFTSWEIALPEESLREHSSGSIRRNGWVINFLYGIEQGEVYLEYFACHRMTNDTLNRVYADGKTELIDACQTGYVEGDEQAKQAFYEHNRKFYENVKRKGLW